MIEAGSGAGIEIGVAGLVLRRPLFLGAVLFTGGIYAASTALFPFWLWLAPVVVALLLGVLGHDSIRARMASVALAAFAAGGLLWLAHHTGPPGDDLSRLVDRDGLPRECVIEGIVRLEHLENDQPLELQCVLDADYAELDGRGYPVAGGVVLACPEPAWTVHAGERVRARGKISARFGYPNFRVSSYEDYWHRFGVYSRLAVAKRYGKTAPLERIAPASRWSGRYWMSRLRKAEADRLAQTAPAEVAPFVKAVWLGYRAQMPRAEYRKYVKAGVAHILSVSGIHASILFVTLRFLLRLVVKSRRRCALLTMLAMGVFALTTGLRPSALRAAIMITAYLSAEVAGRESDAPTTLGLSGLVLLCCNPDLLFDTGFQLSFLSIASIILFAAPLESVLPGRRWVRGPLSVSLGVQVLPLPVAISMSHVFPLAGVFVNLAVIPLSAAILWLAFLTLLTSLVSMHAAQVLGHAAAPLFWLIDRIVDAVAASDWTWLRVVSPTAPAKLAFWGAAGCALAAAATRRRTWTTAAILLALAAAATWRFYMPEARVDFLSVSNGDATVVMSPDAKVMLVDGGDASEVGGEEFSNGEDHVGPFLWSHHIRRLDYVVATHADRDHIGGLFYILENFPVGAVWMPATEAPTPLETRFTTLCAERGVPVRRVIQGDTADLGGGMSVRVLHPPIGWNDGPAPQRTANEGSIVLRVDHNGHRVLLTGDIEKEGERLVKDLDCRADVMKAPHHGSATSSSDDLLEAVDASHCVVTCAGARTVRVDNAALRRYQAHGCNLWRTDVLGGVRVRLDDEVRLESVRKTPQAKNRD